MSQQTTRFIAADAQIVAIRITTGDVTADPVADYVIVCNETDGTQHNINLPAGVNGLTFDFSITGASTAGSTAYLFVANGGDTLDTNIPNPIGPGQAAAPASIKLTFLSGVWYQT